MIMQYRPNITLERRLTNIITTTSQTPSKATATHVTLHASALSGPVWQLATALSSPGGIRRQSRHGDNIKGDTARPVAETPTALFGVDDFRLRETGVASVIEFGAKEEDPAAFWGSPSELRT